MLHLHFPALQWKITRLHFSCGLQNIFAVFRASAGRREKADEVRIFGMFIHWFKLIHTIFSNSVTFESFLTSVGTAGEFPAMRPIWYDGNIGWVQDLLKCTPIAKLCECYRVSSQLSFAYLLSQVEELLFLYSVAIFGNLWISVCPVDLSLIPQTYLLAGTETVF